MRYVVVLCLWCMGVVMASNVIAGVAVRVNGHAITLNEIKKMQQSMKISKQQAIDLLIRVIEQKEKPMIHTRIILSPELVVNRKIPAAFRDGES